MADSKISQLTPVTGANLLDSDEFIVARAGTFENFAVTRAEMFLDTPAITTSDLTATTADINGGTIDGTVIGGTAAAAGTFTNVTATTALTGTLATAAQPNVTSVGTLTSATITGNLTVDTDTLYVDSANNRVGIGTSSPSYKLQVEAANPRIASTSTSAASYASTEVRNNLNSALVNIVRGSTATGTTFGQPNANGAQMYSISADYLAVGTFQPDPLIFGTNNSEAMRIDSSGNVGIGTSSPSFNMHVAGSGPKQQIVETTATDSFSRSGIKTDTASLDMRGYGSTALGSLLGTSRAGSVFSFASGANVYAIGTVDTAPLSFATNNSEAMRIDSSGSVGIGTSSSRVGAQLDVQGGQLVGGMGANISGGVLDWNDITNARSGNGQTLLQGTATNGPGGGGYYHSFCFEYQTSKDGTGNMTQLAIGYNVNSRYMRYRFSGTWSAWSAF